MEKSHKKPEAFIPHHLKAVKILTEIQRINKKYILLIQPKLEKEISDLLEKNKNDKKTMFFLGELFRNSKSGESEKIKDVQFLEPILEKMFKKFSNPQTSESTLFLSENADLYRKPKEGHCYRMKSGSIRHKIIETLMKLEKGKLISSRELMDKSNCGSYKSLTDTIGKINTSAEKSIKFSKKYKLIVSRPPNGYMINDFYTIFPE